MPLTNLKASVQLLHPAVLAADRPITDDLAMPAGAVVSAPSLQMQAGGCRDQPAAPKHEPLLLQAL
jgi:hypothetical protein